MSSYWGVQHGVSKARADGGGRVFSATMRAQQKALGALKPIGPKPPMSIKPPVRKSPK